jgi:hypothetical protein
MYVSLPNIILIDASKNFISKEFVSNANSIAIKVKEVLVKAYNSIRKVKRYYATIRRAFKVILADIGYMITQDYVL